MPEAIASSTQSPKPSFTDAKTSAISEAIERRHVGVGERSRDDHVAGALAHRGERSLELADIGAVFEQARPAGDDEARMRTIIELPVESGEHQNRVLARFDSADG